MAEVQEKIKKYKNYLTLNQKEPLVRAQFQEFHLQMADVKQREAQDLEKLKTVLYYINTLNHIKRKEIECTETEI